MRVLRARTVMAVGTAPDNMGLVMTGTNDKAEVGLWLTERERLALLYALGLLGGSPEAQRVFGSDALAILRKVGFLPSDRPDVVRVPDEALRVGTGAGWGQPTNATDGPTHS